MTKFQNQNPVEIQIFLNCRLIFQKVKSFVSLKTLFLCNLIVFIHLHVEAVQLHMLLKHISTWNFKLPNTKHFTKIREASYRYFDNVSKGAHPYLWSRDLKRGGEGGGGVSIPGTKSSNFLCDPKEILFIRRKNEAIIK